MLPGHVCISILFKFHFKASQKTLIAKKTFIPTFMTSSVCNVDGNDDGDGNDGNDGNDDDGRPAPAPAWH